MHVPTLVRDIASVALLHVYPVINAVTVRIFAASGSQSCGSWPLVKRAVNGTLAP